MRNTGSAKDGLLEVQLQSNFQRHERENDSAGSTGTHGSPRVCDRERAGGGAILRKLRGATRSRRHLSLLGIDRWSGGAPDRVLGSGALRVWNLSDGQATGPRG